MITSIHKSHHTLFCRILFAFIAFAFIFSVALPPGYTQLIPQTLLNLPAPGTMVPPSNGFIAPRLIGVTVYPDNPLKFDFIVNTGDADLAPEALKEESRKLIKYFLASLTVPEDELWVNLSPYEKDRMVPPGLGDTEMGRDMLAQDYLLKQLTASLMYPEKELGKEFWAKIYQEAHDKYGTTEIPVNTFNKVWVVPEQAVVYEKGTSAYVVKSRLKVMLEEDYLAVSGQWIADRDENLTANRLTLSADIIREIILPAIEKEVNEGENFAKLRQMYHSLILAAWYKVKLKDGLLGKIYVDQNKTKGIDTEDKAVNQKIYDRYLESFKKGVYDYIKEDVDPATQDVIPRKYFSGGIGFNAAQQPNGFKGILAMVAASLIIGGILVQPAYATDMIAQIEKGKNNSVEVVLGENPLKSAEETLAALEPSLDVVQPTLLAQAIKDKEKLKGPTSSPVRIVMDSPRRLSQNEKDDIDAKRVPLDNLWEVWGQLDTLLTRLSNEITQNNSSKLRNLLTAIQDDYQFVERAVERLEEGVSSPVTVFVDALKASYDSRVTDEYVKPVVLTDAGGNPIGAVKKGDAWISLNFRRDRTTQLTEALLAGENFKPFPAENLDLMVVDMKEDENGLIPHDQLVLAPVYIPKTVGEYSSQIGLRQFRTAETEKFRHVTRFFNGAYSTQPFAGEDRLLVPSPKDVATYDQKPEMSAYQVTAGLIEKLQANEHDFYLINYANPDMVGHTGNLEATVQAIGHVDKNLQQLLLIAQSQGLNILITADHGNADEMLDKEGKPQTKHSLNPVPLIFVPSRNARLTWTPALLSGGGLADVAPTLLHTMGLEQPAEMTGRNLLQGYSFDKGQKTLIIVLDGFAVNPNRKDPGDAIRLAGERSLTPTLDKLFRENLNTLLDASGESVGLPKGQMGSSETGHMIMGAGRVIKDQPLVKINEMITKDRNEPESFFKNPALLKAMHYARDNRKALHIEGLLSDGGVHSMNTHWYALLEMAKAEGVSEVYLHPVLDGRDVGPQTAQRYLEELQGKIDEIGSGHIVTMMGRFYAMDRDYKWERTKIAYDAYVHGQGERVEVSSPVIVSPSVAGKRNNVGTFLPLQQIRSEEDWGIGDWGVMKKAVDVHAALGQNIIQLLPFNLSSAGNSPYSLASSRLMDPNYINVESLMSELKSAGISTAAAEAFIEENQSQIEALRESNKVDYAAVNRIKMTALKIIWDSFKDRREAPFYREFEQFQEMHQNWLPEHLLYVILKNKFMSEKSNGWDWRTWDEPLRDRNPETIKEAQDAHREQLAFDAFVQFAAYRQYAQLREYADRRNVEIMVDMPYALDGADIWLNPGVFGLKKENGYKALVKQGVPPEPAYPAGQYWQFFPFDWDHPDTVPFILERFQYLQGLASQVRLDHVLGYYRKYLFTEDVEGHMTLERLGLHEKIRSLQRAANSLGTEEAQRDAVKEVRELIAGALLKMRENLPEALKGHLPADAIRLTMNEDGDILDDHMLLIARRVADDRLTEELPEGSPWQREKYVVEKAVYQNQSRWDFLRLTPNEAAKDRGFFYEYLFPGDGSEIKPDDSIRLGYFELIPHAEALMSEFLRLAQEQGTPLIWETLGVVPSQIQKSVERLGGTNYIPVIWGEVPRWGEKRNPYYPAHHIENAFATFGLHDSTTMRNRWERELGRETKVKMLDGFFGKDQWSEEDVNVLTPRVREKLLDMVYASRARIAVLTWIDLLGLGEEYRLNSPGEGGQWLNRLPRDVTLENLLKAAKDEPVPEAAAEAVTLIRELTSKGGRTAQAPGWELKIAHVIPEVGGEVIQIREVGQSFLVDAYVEGNPEKVILVLTEPGGNQEKQIELQSSNDNAAGERNGLPGRWRANVPADRVGQWDFYVEAQGADGNREQSGIGRLVTVAQHADLNPLSKGYVLSPSSPPVTKAGMAFIFGTGNNGTAVEENGEVYTADNSLLELGHNILYKAKLGKWVFTGKETRGDMPLREEGDRSFEDSFSGPNLAKRFSLMDEQAKEVARRYVQDLPEGIGDVEGLLTYIKKEGALSEEEKKLREKAADALLKGITKAVGDGYSGAKTFVMSMGEEIGTALAAMMKYYYHEQWVENFVLVSGIGENFARVETDHGDIFIEAIKNGLKTALEEARDNEGYKDLTDERIDVIVAGIKRSNMTWEREILAARLTGREIQEYAKQGEARDNLLSVGVSVGGTKIGAGSIASDGEILRRVEVKWRDQYNESPEDVTGAVMDQIKEVLKGVDESRVKKIGIAFAGPVDKERGIVGTPFKAPNLPFENYALAQEIERRYRDWVQNKYGEDVATRVEVKVEIRNDGEAAVLGEVLSPKGMLSGETSSPVEVVAGAAGDEGGTKRLRTFVEEALAEDPNYFLVADLIRELTSILVERKHDTPASLEALLSAINFIVTEYSDIVLFIPSDLEDAMDEVNDSYDSQYLETVKQLFEKVGEEAPGGELPETLEQFTGIIEAYLKDSGTASSPMRVHKSYDSGVGTVRIQSEYIPELNITVHIRQPIYGGSEGDLVAPFRVMEYGDHRDRDGFEIVKMYKNGVLFPIGIDPFKEIQKNNSYNSGVGRIDIVSTYNPMKDVTVHSNKGIWGGSKDGDLISAFTVWEKGNQLNRTGQEIITKYEKGEFSSSPIEESVANPGGIDLNPALLDLQIKRDGNGVPLPLPMQPIEHMRIEGFLPIIINVTPVTNLPLLLGIVDDESPTDSADSELQPMELGFAVKEN